MLAHGIHTRLAGSGDLRRLSLAAASFVVAAAFFLSADLPLAADDEEESLSEPLLSEPDDDECPLPDELPELK